MIVLDSINKSIQIILGGAVTTNELDYFASFIDVNPEQYVPISSDGVTNGGTAVTAIAAPTTKIQRQVKLITVFNADTVSATVTVRLNNNGTFRILVKIALAADSTLVYTDGEGFRVIDTAGAIQ